MIAVTGDLTELAAPSEFGQAFDVLDRPRHSRRLESTVDPRHHVVVPGNHHDVVCNEPVAERRPYCAFHNKLFRRRASPSTSARPSRRAGATASRSTPTASS